ncbi:hypothetical protein [Gordonia iterans]
MASQKKRKKAPVPSVRTGPSPHDAHDLVYFKRHAEDDPGQSEPGRNALQSWPASVRAKANAVLIAVAIAPPKRFAGGGYWEAMKGDMSGWFEVRIDGPKRHHYRLFCLLDYEAKGQDKPLLVVVDGRDKPFRTTLSGADYAAVRSMGEEYLKRNPRSIG